MAPAEDRRTFSIRQLCREFGVTARALRFYEDKDLLHPGRRGQTRVYAARDRARLQLILQGKRVGFSLIEIREMLDLYDRKDGNAVQMAVSLKKFRRQLDALPRQREDLEAAIKPSPAPSATPFTAAITGLAHSAMALPVSRVMRLWAW